MLARKSGRRISAANRAKIEDAISHSEDAIRILRAILASDDDAQVAEALRSWAVGERRL